MDCRSALSSKRDRDALQLAEKACALFPNELEGCFVKVTDQILAGDGDPLLQWARMRFIKDW